MYDKINNFNYSKRKNKITSGVMTSKTFLRYNTAVWGGISYEI